MTQTIFRLRLVHLLIFGLSLLAAPLARAVDNDTQAEKPLVLGLLPSESAVSKFKHYAPLRDYLSQHLHRKVILETARDFPEFLKRSIDRRYDLLETAPHFVSATLDSKKYEVLATLAQPLAATIVVGTDSVINGLPDLKRHTVATPGPNALVTRLGRDLIAEQGLTGTDSPIFKPYKTHNAAYEAVLGKQADAAIIASNQYIKAMHNHLPLRAVAQGKELPNMSILAALDLPLSLRREIQETLLHMQNSSEGKASLQQMSYPGYRASSASEYEPLRRYSK